MRESLGKILERPFDEYLEDPALIRELDMETFEILTHTIGSKRTSADEDDESLNLFIITVRQVQEKVLERMKEFTEMGLRSRIKSDFLVMELDLDHPKISRDYQDIVKLALKGRKKMFQGPDKKVSDILSPNLLDKYLHFCYKTHAGRLTDELLYAL